MKDTIYVSANSGTIGNMQIMQSIKADANLAHFFSDLGARNAGIASLIFVASIADKTTYNSIRMK